jgi:hypothetical protein
MGGKRDGAKPPVVTDTGSFLLDEQNLDVATIHVA